MNKRVKAFPDGLFLLLRGHSGKEGCCERFLRHLCTRLVLLRVLLVVLRTTTATGVRNWHLSSRTTGLGNLVSSLSALGSTLRTTALLALSGHSTLEGTARLLSGLARNETTRADHGSRNLHELTLLRHSHTRVGRGIEHWLAGVQRLSGHRLVGDTHLSLPLVERLQLCTARILALVQGHIQGFTLDHAVVHLRNGSGSLLLGSEANETESPAVPAFIRHHFSTCNGAILREQLAKLIIVNGVIQVLDVQVETLELLIAFHAQMLLAPAKKIFAFSTLLRTPTIKNFPLHLLSIQPFDSSGSAIGFGEAHETKATRVAIAVVHHNATDDLAILSEQLLQVLIRVRSREVLHVDVVVALLGLAKFAQSLLPLLEVSNKNFLAIQHHPIKPGNRVICSFLRFKVNEAEPFAVSL
eukprot:Rmarinus@m.17613